METRHKTLIELFKMLHS